jgi:hypothetical protein
MDKINIDKEIYNSLTKIKSYEREIDEIRNQLENTNCSEKNKLKFQKQIDRIQPSHVAEKYVLSSLLNFKTSQIGIFIFFIKF